MTHAIKGAFLRAVAMRTSRAFRSGRQSTARQDTPARAQSISMDEMLGSMPVTCLLPRIPRDWEAVALMMMRHFGEEAANIASAKMIAYRYKGGDFEAART